MPPVQHQIKNLNHLGLVAAMCRELMMAEYFDACITNDPDARNEDLPKAVKRWSTDVLSGFPVFRKRSIAHHSTMRFPDFSTRCAMDNRRIKLSRKSGFVGLFKSQGIEGKPKSATVMPDACGNWHVSILCEVERDIPVPLDGEACGIDMGIAKNITCSTELCGDSGVFVGVHSYRKNADQLAREQRKLSRKAIPVAFRVVTLLASFMSFGYMPFRGFARQLLHALPYLLHPCSCHPGHVVFLRFRGFAQLPPHCNMKSIGYKGGSNWKKQKQKQKQKQKVSRIHTRIANVRRDYLQQATTEISNNHAMIFCEDLKVRNMSESAKGTVDKQGVSSCTL